MKRITFVIPDELNVLLESERRRRELPAAAVIREALQAHLAGNSRPKTLSFIGLGHSGHHDTATRIDEILAEEWDAAGGR